MSALATELERLAEVEQKIVAVELQIAKLTPASAGRLDAASIEAKVAIVAAEVTLEAFHAQRRRIFLDIDDLSREALR